MYARRDYGGIVVGSFQKSGAATSLMICLLAVILVYVFSGYYGTLN